MAARFKSGDEVEVQRLPLQGHIRTPYYVRGKRGWVVEYCGHFLNPEQLAVGDTSGPAIALYRIGFRQKDLWPDYSGLRDDKLFIEIYEHWLAPVPAPAE